MPDEKRKSELLFRLLCSELFETDKMPYKDKITGIYLIKSKCHPEREYIGCTVNIYRRWVYHRKDFRDNKHSSIQFQRHYNKYGFGDFEFSIVAICDKNELIPVDGVVWLEQFFIWAYKYGDTNKPYFNAAPLAGSLLGIKYPPEYGEKISKYQKGRKRPPRIISEKEHARRSEKLIGNTRGKGNKGKKQPKHVTEILRKINTGREKTPETKEKHRQANLGNKYCLGYKHTAKARENMSLAQQKRRLTSRSEKTRQGKSKVCDKLRK